MRAAEAGAAALRRVWPARAQAMDPAEAEAIRSALRSLEDGWATLAAVRSTDEQPA